MDRVEREERLRCLGNFAKQTEEAYNYAWIGLGEYMDARLAIYAEVEALEEGSLEH